MTHSDSSTASSFRELLDPDALPVYGSTLRAEDFEHHDDRWRARVLTAAAELDVRLTGEKDAMTCLLDGRPYSFLHPYRKTLDEPAATAQEWFDHFCALQAESAPRRERSWERTSVQAMLERAGHGITAYDQRERSGSELRRVADAQAWLDTNLAGTQVSVTVHPLADMPLRTDGKLIGRMLCMIQDDQIAGYRPVPLASDLPVDQFYSIPGFPHGLSPYIHVRTSGHTILGHRADLVLDADDVLPHLTDNPGSGARETPWLLIHVTGTRCVLPFPASVSNLIVDVDGDGSQVSIRVASSEQRARRLELEDRFDRRWGEFLDDDRPVDPANVAAAMERAESTVDHHIQQERERHADAQ